MNLYRIARKKYIDDLSGEGARKYGGRWNRKGISVLYTSEYESLAVLEILVHTPVSVIPDDLTLLVLTIPDELSYKQVDITALPDTWRHFPAPRVLAEVGSEWAVSGESLLLKVPSVLTVPEFNFLINPAHPDFSQVSKKDKRPFTFDNRLIN